MPLTFDLQNPNDISNFLLIESRERGDVLTNLKLQKLLYYSQAWMLTLNSVPLFDEDFQAWIHGPVLPSEYTRFKSYTWKPILEELAKPTLPDCVSKHLSDIIDNFGVETATSLELMTHNEKPWIDARGGIPSDQICTNVISKEAMINFYGSL